MWMMILFLGCISKSSKPQEKKLLLKFHTHFPHIIPRAVQNQAGAKLTLTSPSLEYVSVSLKAAPQE